MTLKEKFKQQPLESDIKSNEDGSVFIPIGIVQNKLDDLPDAEWSFILTEYTANKKTISGFGELIIEYWEEAHKYVIRRTGSATLDVSIEVKGSLPWLESEMQKNAAKKLGPWFGRDLNRENNDFQTAKLPVIKKGADITDTEDDEAVERSMKETEEKIKKCTTRAEALQTLTASGFQFNNSLKLLANSKPE